MGKVSLPYSFNGEISPRFILRKYYKSKRLVKRKQNDTRPGINFGLFGTRDRFMRNKVC